MSLCLPFDKLRGPIYLTAACVSSPSNQSGFYQARATAGARRRGALWTETFEVKNMTCSVFPPIYVTSRRTSVADCVVTTLTSQKSRANAVSPYTEYYKPMPIPSAPSYYMDGTELSSTSQLEAEQRALQLAIEYSMLGLTSEDDTTNTFDELRAKKSVNMTECVPVPSSEHVAEIVGRQGCKIKALRAKTNTYIKTPVRGEDPVFVITGRKEDVAVAKQEILSAANHFSQIRAQRKNSTLNSGPSSPTGGPGQTTIQVRVPYRVVGLVVGPKGATIKRIQQATNTYIVTPSRDKEPIFEVTGSLENVESARKEIENHIVLRTGGLLDDDVFQGNGDALNSFNSFQGGHIYTNGRQPGRDLHRALSTDSFYLNSSKITDYNALASPFSTSSNGTSNGYFFNHDLIPSPTDDLIIPNHNSTGFNSSPPPPSPSIWGADTKSDTNAFSTSNGALNGVGSIGSGRPTTPHTTARRLASEPLLPGLPPSTTLGSFSRFTTSTTAPIGTLSTSSSALTTTTTVNGEIPRVNGVVGSRSPSNVDSTNNNTINNVASKKKECVVCCGAEVVAALVPCGHNFFCMECATKLKTDDSSCPVCQQQVTQVLRIIS